MILLNYLELGSLSPNDESFVGYHNLIADIDIRNLCMILALKLSQQANNDIIFDFVHL